MSTPNAFISEVYGTTKVAGPVGALVAGLLTNKMMAMGAERDEYLREEARRMNQLTRALEAQKMRATHGGLTRPRGGMAPDLTHYEDQSWPDPVLFQSSLYKGGSAKYAAAAGRELVLRSLEDGMDKEAIGALAAMLPGIGKLLGKVAPKLLGAASKTTGVTSRVLGRTGSTIGRMGSRMTGVAKTQAMPAIGAAAKAPTSAVASAAPGGAQGFWSKIMSGTGKPPVAGAAKATGAAGAAAAPAAATGTSGGFLSGLLKGKAPQSGWQKFKSAVTPGWRTKALLGGTALLGVGGLYAGGKAFKDYMTIPSGMGGYHTPGAGYGVQHNVSGYGGGYSSGPGVYTW